MQEPRSLLKMDKLKPLIIIYIMLLINEKQAIKINKIAVPNHHIIEDGKPLLLECDYSIDDDESGFVLKWYFNSIPIYQWIPTRVPFALNSFKGRVDTGYIASSEFFSRHSTLAITNPSPFDSGNYTCSVQTFQRFDERTAAVLIEDLDQSMNLTMQVIENEGNVYVECSVLEIYNLFQMEIEITISGKDSSISLDKYELEKINKYVAEMSIEELSDQSTFTCLASFNEIDYKMKKAITYREIETTFNPKKLVRFLSSLLLSYGHFIRFYFN